MIRGLGTYAVATVLALIIATAAFVRHRNTQFTERELGRARAAAAAVAAGERPLVELVAGAVIAPPETSTRYPFLRRRHVVGGRALGGAHLANASRFERAVDKLLYDAATAGERDGAFARFVQLPDGGADLVVAALPLPAGVHSAERGTAIVVARPASRPESFPWLVVLGLVAMGALVVTAGSFAGGGPRVAALAMGASGLAVPAFMWGGFAPAIAIGAVAFAAAFAHRAGWMDRAATELRVERVAYSFVTPAALAMLVLVAVPFVAGLVIGFYDHNSGQWHFVGLRNFGAILGGDGRSLSDPLNFWFTLGVTVAWTAVNVVLHVGIGVSLALLLSRRGLAGRGVFRMLLILPWAIPNYITALIWRGMFQSQYGAVNELLAGLGLDKVDWFSSWATSFTANVTANTWLGFPFMMVVALGALESIPRDMYEAAEVDGASPWQRFWHITMPHLRPAMLPAIALGSIWTFNMFNVIYLVSGGAPNASTDILVTEAYRWAFERGERYGMAAAYATLIFLILVLWTTVGSRLVKRRRTA